MANIKQTDRNKKILIGTVLVILFIAIAVLTKNLLEKKSQPTSMTPIPTPVQGSGVITSASGVEKTSAIHLEQQGNNTVNVVVDSGKGAISGVQLQLSYDPQVLSNVVVQKGSFFVSPIELSHHIDSTKGIINYVIAISPQSAPQQGKGIVATITYTPNMGVATNATLTFLPGTKVTAEGIDESVLQMPPPFNITINQ